MAVIPSDQMSVLQLYLFLESTSGLIQKGLPIRVSLSARVCISSADAPKSDNLISPNSLIRMFPALISRWIVLRWCKYSNPRSVGCRIEAICYSVSLVPGDDLSTSLIDPTFQSSYHLHNTPETSKCRVR
jgi:hypothetical protein